MHLEGEKAGLCSEHCKQTCHLQSAFVQWTARLRSYPLTQGVKSCVIKGHSPLLEKKGCGLSLPHTSTSSDTGWQRPTQLMCYSTGNPSLQSGLMERQLHTHDNLTFLHQSMINWPISLHKRVKGWSLMEKCIQSCCGQRSNGLTLTMYLMHVFIFFSLRTEQLAELLVPLGGSVCQFWIPRDSAHLTPTYAATVLTQTL